MGSIFGGSKSGGFQAQGPDPAQVKAQYGQTQAGIKQQQDFVNALGQQNGLGNQSNVFNQYQGIANGTGPNPAQAMLNQSTGQNVANQAALMAGQRGASANTGMMARQAANQGANQQQNSIGQAASLQAQQQQNALGAMGSMANTQVGQQQQGLAQLGQQNQALYGNLTGQQDSANQINASMAQQRASAENNMLSNVTGAIGTAVGGVYGGSLGAKAGAMLGKSIGAEGGAVDQLPVVGPKSMFGQHIHGYAEGGKVPALVSPGERYLPPQEVQKVAQGKKAPMQAGEKIPGKPKVGGAKNDYANDTVHKTLDEGGIVLPRSVTQSKDAGAKAAAFVEAILAKKSLPKKK